MQMQPGPNSSGGANSPAALRRRFLLEQELQQLQQAQAAQAQLQQAQFQQHHGSQFQQPSAAAAAAAAGLMGNSSANAFSQAALLGIGAAGNPSLQSTQSNTSAAAAAAGYAGLLSGQTGMLGPGSLYQHQMPLQNQPQQDQEQQHQQRTQNILAAALANSRAAANIPTQNPAMGGHAAHFSFFGGGTPGGAPSAGGAQLGSLSQQLAAQHPHASSMLQQMVAGGGTGGTGAGQASTLGGMMGGQPGGAGSSGMHTGMGAANIAALGGTSAAAAAAAAGVNPTGNMHPSPLAHLAHNVSAVGRNVSTTDMMQAAAIGGLHHHHGGHHHQAGPFGQHFATGGNVGAPGASPHMMLAGMGGIGGAVSAAAAAAAEDEFYYQQKQQLSSPFEEHDAWKKRAAAVLGGVHHSANMAPMKKRSIDLSYGSMGELQHPGSKRPSLSHGRRKRHSLPATTGKSAKDKKETSGPPKAKNFPQKFMEAMEKEKDEDAVAWLPDGKSFVVVDSNMLVERVLPQFCGKQNCKYTSFVRKLHRWGFVRLTSGTGTDCFHHPLFQRNKLELCQYIVCTPRTGSGGDGKQGQGAGQARAKLPEAALKLLGSKNDGPPSLAGVEKFIRKASTISVPSLPAAPTSLQQQQQQQQQEEQSQEEPQIPQAESGDDEEDVTRGGDHGDGTEESI